jgi:uncharacterized membrane protein
MPDEVAREAAADEASTAARASEASAIGRADEADRSYLGQRRVNLLWERTQAIIAISVVEVTLAICAYIVVAGDPTGGPGSPRVLAFVLLSGLVNLVVGFYFGRTNHTRTGGTGTPPER